MESLASVASLYSPGRLSSLALTGKQECFPMLSPLGLPLEPAAEVGIPLIQGPILPIPPRRRRRRWWQMAG